MSLETDLERIALQEEKLRFGHFDNETAWEIGHRLKAAAEKHGGAIAIDIQLHGQPLFFYAMPGTVPDNVEWIRRKRNVVARFHRSSYGMGLSLQRDGTSLQAKSGLDLKDYATHGGCFPILLQGGICIGTITVSGLPQREDHKLVAGVLADFLSVPRAGIELD